MNKIEYNIDKIIYMIFLLILTGIIVFNCEKFILVPELILGILIGICIAKLVLNE